MQGKLSAQYSGVKFSSSLLFCQIFFQMNGFGRAVRTNISQAVGLGSKLCRGKYFYGSIDISQKFQLLPWQRG